MMSPKSLTTGATRLQATAWRVYSFYHDCTYLEFLTHVAFTYAASSRCTSLQFNLDRASANMFTSPAIHLGDILMLNRTDNSNSSRSTAAQYTLSIPTTEKRLTNRTEFRLSLQMSTCLRCMYSPNARTATKNPNNSYSVELDVSGWRMPR